jgi:hypothetical protein
VIRKTGLAQADAHDVPPAWLCVEIGIVGENTGNLSVAHAQRLRDKREPVRRHMAERFIEFHQHVQNADSPAGLRRDTRENLIELVRE